LFIVVVLQAAAEMVMMFTGPVLVIMSVVIVIMVVSTVAFEKFRFDLENAVEIESVAPQHFRQRNPPPFGTMQPGVRMEAADARLGIPEFVGLHEIRLVEQNNVGERDLVLRLGGVLEAIFEPPSVGDGDDRIELRFAADIVVEKKGLCYRRGIRQSG